VRGELERHRDRLGQLAKEQLELESRLSAITADEAAHLPPHDPPESAAIEPESASRVERFETWFEQETGQDRTE
jgi:hypothetical protein